MAAPISRECPTIELANPGTFGAELTEIANQIAQNAVELEAELVEAGYLPRAVNEL
jgi:hypothetical protein